jgi:hypothetical protein
LETFQGRADVGGTLNMVLPTARRELGTKSVKTLDRKEQIEYNPRPRYEE